jgi:hypothetical protein
VWSQEADGGMVLWMLVALKKDFGAPDELRRVSVNNYV